MKKLITICALVLAVAVAGAAYAEVQSVKVSGDITLRGIVRSNYDMKTEVGNGASESFEDEYAFYMSTTRVQIDADLTDNVATTVRILNERDWDGPNSSDDEDMQLDLANITLKELFYSPLTVVLGRQEIHLGNDFIVGDFDGTARSNSSLTADDYSAIKSVDAMSAVLDLDPYSITLFTAKMDENSVNISDDIDVHGINVGTQFADYNAEAELYFVTLADDTNFNYGVVNSAATTLSTRRYEEREIYTLGLRGSMNPVEGLTVGAEIAKQFGELRDQVITGGITGEQNTTTDRDADGMAIQVGADYDIPDLMYPVNIGVEYTYLSGEEKANGGDYGNWIPIAENQVLGEIVEAFANTTFDANGNAAGMTNVSVLAVSGTIKPLDDVTVGVDYYHYWLDEKPTAITYSAGSEVGRAASDDFGDEVDVNVIYDYTEDVSFGVLGAVFLPGDTFTSDNNDNSYQLVGSVNVAF